MDIHMKYVLQENNAQFFIYSVNNKKLLNRFNRITKYSRKSFINWKIIYEIIVYHCTLTNNYTRCLDWHFLCIYKNVWKKKLVKLLWTYERGTNTQLNFFIVKFSVAKKRS